MNKLEKIKEFHLFAGSKPKILQQIFFGAPGTGKSFTIEQETKGEDTIRTTFHPDSDYSTFVGAYKPVMDDVDIRVIPVVVNNGISLEQNKGTVKEKRITYQFVKQAFLKAYLAAWKKMADNSMANPKKQFLIIEEINRGNCAQIFGDLFQLLDRSSNGYSTYTIDSDTDIQREIERAFKEDENYRVENLTIEPSAVEDYHSNYGKTLEDDILHGRVLLLPPNLYIWATMNTSDQSLFPIDSAFKRRWDWQYVPIADAGKGWKIHIYGKNYDWWDFLKNINNLVGSTTHSEDKKLGYFFCKTNNGVISAETFVSKVIFYLWNDVFRDFEFDDEIFNDTETDSNGNVTKLTFDKFYDTDENGIPIVKEDKVDIFMTNLGVKFVQDVVDEKDIYSDSEDSRATGFSLNGNPMNLCDIAMTVVLNYANNHPSSSAQEVRDYFINLCKGIGVSHIVETESEYHLRDDQSSQQRSASEITIPNGEKLYVTTQWRGKNENDNFIRFMDIVNSNDLGLISRNEEGEQTDYVDESDNGGDNYRESLSEICFPDGTIITTKNQTQFNAFIEAIKKIGLEKVFSVADRLKYRRLNCPLLTRAKNPIIEADDNKYSYYEIDGYYFVKGAKHYTYVRILEDLSKMLNLNINVICNRPA